MANGVLRVRVGGVWQDVPTLGPIGPAGPQGPPGDDVFVGPSDPGPTYELWYDTDDMSGMLMTPHAAQHTAGGSDPITVADSQLSANIPKLNIANTFTGQQTISSGSRVKGSFGHLWLEDTAAPADKKIWRLCQYQDGNIILESMNDAENAYHGRFRFYRTGDVAIDRDVYEKGRTVPMGHWTSWTPSVTDQAGTGIACNTRCFYSVVGKTVFYSLKLENVAAANGTAYLQVSMPPGWTPTGLNADCAGIIRLYLSSVGYTTGIYSLDPGGFITIHRHDTSSYPAGPHHLYLVSHYWI